MADAGYDGYQGGGGRPLLTGSKVGNVGGGNRWRQPGVGLRDATAGGLDLGGGQGAVSAGAGRGVCQTVPGAAKPAVRGRTVLLHAFAIQTASLGAGPAREVRSGLRLAWREGTYPLG